MYTDLERDFEEYLKEEFTELDNIQQWQRDLQSPFDMEVIQRFGQNKEQKLSAHEQEDLALDEVKTE